MKVTQVYTGCLSQGAYYIEDNGEVAIIDPLRDVQSYIEKAQKEGSEIKYIFETHFHADFVSGHLTLSQKTNAPIIFGPTATPSFKAHIARDNEVFKLGQVSLTVLHTPGHTMESITILLKDKDGKDYAIFSGDTLFLGDVGRPDLAQKATNLTQEELAGFLYDSLRKKIMPLPDDTIVYPAHGAGSACGKNLSRETMDTIGNQKETNYALRENMTKAEFIKEVTDGLLPPPAYFPMNVKLNKAGYKNIDEVLKTGAIALEVNDFENKANLDSVLILDVRHQSEFVNGHVPKSIFIGINGSFAPWAGALIKDISQHILLVAPQGREAEAVTRLARVGFDNVIGYLNGGFESWRASAKKIETLPCVSANVLEEKIKENFPVFDVRKPAEYDSGHIVNVPNTPLDFLNDYMDKFPVDEDFYIHCAGGYRSVIACSILKARGFHNVIDVDKGYSAIKQTDIPKTKSVILE